VGFSTGRRITMAWPEKCYQLEMFPGVTEGQKAGS
jgi:hypothetical protein